MWLYLVRVCSERNSERPRKSEIGQLEVTFFVDQQVLRLQISVQDAVRVQVVHSLDELISLRTITR